MEQTFARNRSDIPTTAMRPGSTLETVQRGFMVQSMNMNSVGVQAADVVIEPDVTQFDLTEFNRTDELASVGEQTTLESLPRIKELLARF